MAALKIRVSGHKINDVDVATKKENTETLELKEVYVIGATTRGEIENREEITLDETKVVEFTYDDKTVWLGDNTTIDELFPGTSTQMRSIGTGDETIIDIPTEVTISESGRSLDIGSVVLKIVKVFTKKKVEQALTPILDTTVKLLANKFEKQQLEGRLDKWNPYEGC